jgi:archaellum biogenesis ATPase FlaH
MNLSEEIKNSNIMLLVVPKEKYHEELIEIIRVIAENVKKTCYVCINEPYNFVVNNLKKNNIALEKFFFIDTLTMKVQEPPEVDNCIFVSAPNALTEISLAFSKVLNEVKCDSTLFDTISALMIYENPHSIVQFVHNILTKIRVSNGKAVFIALKEDINSELVKDLYMFVDKVVDLAKN